jgi:hypothetical protein
MLLSNSGKYKINLLSLEILLYLHYGLLGYNVLTYVATDISKVPTAYTFLMIAVEIFSAV